MIHPLVGRTSYSSAERKRYIGELKKDITVYKGLPIYLRDDPLIVKTLHEIASNKFEFISMGYDVLKEQFFANELFHFTDKDGTDCKFLFPYFSTDFGSFFNHVRGNIYKKSCYFGYTFSEEEIKKYKIDINRINYVSLVDETIDSLDMSFVSPETNSGDADIWYNSVNEIVRVLEQEVPSEALEKLKAYNRSAHCSCNSWGWDVITPAIMQWVKQNPETAITKISELMTNSSFPRLFDNGIKAIAILYPNEMLEAMPTHVHSGTKRKRNDVRDSLIDALEKGTDIEETKGYDTTLNTFYIKRTVYSLGQVFCRYALTYHSFSDFADALSNDLSGCNLLHAQLDSIDLSQYKTDSNTVVGAKYLNYEPEDKIIKGFWNGRFHIQHCLKDKNGNTLALKTASYSYFFDFLHVLKNDLSECLLLECEDLENVPDLLKYHADKAKISSNILIKAGIKPKQLDIFKYEIQQNIAFKLAEDNEKITSTALVRHIEEPECKDYRVYYISDLHLHNKLQRIKGIKTEADIMHKIHYWVDLLSNSRVDKKGSVIIAGDICHEKKLCYDFLRCLSRKKINAVIIPGNHELWFMNPTTLEEDLSDYRDFVEGLGMTFLYNCILYKYNDEPNWKRISEEEITQLSIQEIRNKTRYARHIVFGGLGFSGYAPFYNATIKLYDETIPSIQEDLTQTQRFEALYEKIEQCFYDREIIVATHTPLDNWSRSAKHHKGWIYISGHTHHNYFQDDGDMRIYSDNQSGYKGQHFYLKSVLVEGEYDVFADCADGIYPITAKQYLDFARGKNMKMTFNRKDMDVYMLKRNGYYCFIGQAKEKQALYILNGGVITRLHLSTVQDCYDCMDAEIELIEKPLSQYTALQEQISSFIKSIGGYGEIHGCIIDIDYPGTHGPWSMNHLYLNPEDGKITCYYANSIVDKQLYANFASLLKYSCPELFKNYQALLQYAEDNSFPPALLLVDQELTSKTTPYESTDMYRASRRIKAMQYLNKNILRTWVNVPYSSPKTLPKTNKRHL